MKSVDSKQGKQHPLRLTESNLSLYDCSGKKDHGSPSVQFVPHTGNKKCRQTLNGNHSSRVIYAIDELRQEAVNMLELTCSQSGRKTPLSISSKGTQAVLKQF